MLRPLRSLLSAVALAPGTALAQAGQGARSTEEWALWLVFALAAAVALALFFVPRRVRRPPGA